MTAFIAALAVLSIGEVQEADSDLWCLSGDGNMYGFIAVNTSGYTDQQINNRTNTCVSLVIYLDNVVVDNLSYHFSHNQQVEYLWWLPQTHMYISFPVDWMIEYNEYIITGTNFPFVNSHTDSSLQWYRIARELTPHTHKIFHLKPADVMLTYPTASHNDTIHIHFHTPPIEPGLSFCAYSVESWTEFGGKIIYDYPPVVGQVTLFGLYDGTYTQTCYEPMPGLDTFQILLYYFQIELPPTTSGYTVHGNCTVGRLTNPSEFVASDVVSDGSLTHLKCASPTPNLTVHISVHNHTYGGDVTVIHDYETSIIVTGTCNGCIKLGGTYPNLKEVVFDSYIGDITQYTFPSSITSLRMNHLHGDILPDACKGIESIDVMGNFTGMISPNMGVCRFTAGCTTSPTPSPSQPQLLDCTCPAASCSGDSKSVVYLKIAIFATFLTAVGLTGFWVFQIIITK